MEINPSGWCCRYEWCAGIAVECVRPPGRVALCCRCWAEDLGLPEGSDAGAVVAELQRRADL